MNRTLDEIVEDHADEDGVLPGPDRPKELDAFLKELRRNPGAWTTFVGAVLKEAVGKHDELSTDQLSNAVGVRRRAEADAEASRDALDRAIMRAHRRGISYRDIAARTGMSHQRVAQIVKET